MATLNQQSTAQFVGEIGMDVPAWLQNYLVEVRSHIERLTTDPTQPGGVLGLTVTKNNLGNLISWSAPVVGAAYQVFRNSSGDFTTATQIAELQGHNNISFFDGVDQLTAAQTRYYWVRALNAAGLGGPISAVATSTNFAADGTSTAVGVDAVAAGSGGTAVGRNAKSGTGANSTAIGVSALIGSGSNNTAVGQGAEITGGNNVAVGYGAWCKPPIGNSVALGYVCNVTGDTSVGVGAGVNMTQADCVGVGSNIGITGARSTGVGKNVQIAHADCTVIGKDGASTAPNQVIIGTASSVVGDIWLGRGVTHTGSQSEVIVHAADGTGADVPGDVLALQAGRPTGSGLAGSISFRAAVTSVVSGTTLRTATEQARIQDSVFYMGQPTTDIVGVGSFSVVMQGELILSPTSSNTSHLRVNVSGSTVDIKASKSGSGTFYPMQFWTSDIVRLYIGTNGNIGINTASPATNLAVAGNAVFGAQGGYTTNSILSIGKGSAVAPGDLSISSGSAYGFVTGVIAEVTANSTSVIGGYVYSGTVISGGVTLTNQYGLYVDAISKSGGTVTTGTGLYVATPTAGTTNIAATFAGAGGVQLGGIISQYKGVTTNGLGVPAIYKSGRSTAQTAAVASVAAYTNAAVDGSFLISANVNVTTSTLHNFTVTVAYTDETNTARTLTLTFAQLAGTLVTAITNATGAGPYEGIPLHIRCKASTAITIATTGTFTTVTYNVEGYITQIG